jgi:intein-encoded DNA endonuclease-like protein
LSKLGLSRSNKTLARKYDVNHNYFNVIDEERKAYWLGFFYADGFVCRNKKQKNVGISLGAKDGEHLELLKSDIDATYKIHTYSSFSFGTKVVYNRLLMTSDKMYDDLINKGAVERKSLILKFPTKEIVPDDLINHFMRGYFDGDGSFSKSKSSIYQFKLCGTMEFLSSCFELLGFPKVKLYKRRKCSTRNNFQGDIGGRLQVKKIGDFLYRDSSICLDRKYQRYLQLRT